MLQENDKDLTFFLFLLMCFVLFCCFLLFFKLLVFRGCGLKVKPITAFIECEVKWAFF